MVVGTKGRERGSWVRPAEALLVLAVMMLTGLLVRQTGLREGAEGQRDEARRALGVCMEEVNRP